MLLLWRSMMLPTWRLPGQAQQPGRLRGAPTVVKGTTACRFSSADSASDRQHRTGLQYTRRAGEGLRAKESVVGVQWHALYAHQESLSGVLLLVSAAIWK